MHTLGFYLAVNKLMIDNNWTFWLQKIFFKQMRLNYSNQQYNFFQVMQTKILWNNPELRQKLWNDLVICIPKTNSSRSLDMQIGLQLKDRSCRLQ